MIAPREQGPKFAFPDSFGFCGGVAAADNLMQEAGQLGQDLGVPVYGFHGIVHNDVVIASHEANGVKFVDSLDGIPEGSAVVISAHGASPAVFHEIEQRGSSPIDATCPLVKHAQSSIERARVRQEKVLYVCKGKPGEVEKLHDEVAGAVGHMDYRLDDDQLVSDPVDRAFLELDDDPEDVSSLLTEAGKYCLVGQTTLNADDFMAFRARVKASIQATQPEASVRWSSAATGEVCRAVADRQKGVAQLVEISPKRVVVVTDPDSKNGMGYVALAGRLVEENDMDTEVVAVASGREAGYIQPIDGLTAITASASTPTESIQEVLTTLGGESVPTIKERTFVLPDASRVSRIMVDLAEQRKPQP